MKNLSGTWLKIKTEDNYCPLEFIEFNNNQIIHFKLESKYEMNYQKPELNGTRNYPNQNTNL